MATRDEVHVDPGCLTGGAGSTELEIVVPYTGPESTAAALARAEVLAAGFHARVQLIAVHTLPYPVPFICPILVHAHLVQQLLDLANGCALDVQPQVILARDRMEGFKYTLKPNSTVLVASPRHFWRTQEEKLARSLARAGHNVALVHIA